MDEVNVNAKFQSLIRRSAQTAHATGHIELNHTMVNQRRKSIGKKHCQHGAFRITVVVGTDDYGHHAHKESVEILAGICSRPRSPDLWP